MEQKVKTISMALTLGLFATVLSLCGVFGPTAAIAVKWGLVSLVVLYIVAFVYRLIYRALKSIVTSPRNEETKKVDFEIEKMMNEIQKEEIKIKPIAPKTLNQLQNNFKK